MKFKKYRKRTMKNLPKPANPDADMLSATRNPDNNNSQTEANKTVTEVIDLDHYDGTGRKRRKRFAWNKCVNLECESGENLRPATIFCLNYYRVKIKPTKLQEICEACYTKSVEYYEELSTALTAGEYLIKQALPLHDEYVEIDSDESGDEDDVVDVCAAGVTACQISDSCHGFLASELPKAMNRVLEDLDLDKQVERACEHISRKQDSNAAGIEDLFLLEKSFQSQIDTIRNNLYSQFTRQVEQLPAEEFSILLPSGAGLGACTSPPKPERRSLRATAKPATYCEDLEDVHDDKTKSYSLDELEVTHEVIPVSTPSSESSLSLPPRGALVRPAIVVGEVYYAQRQSVFGAWGKVKLLEIDQELYKVKFETKIKGQTNIKQVTGKQLAYAQPSAMRLEVGTRVIAVFSDEQSIKRESYYLGIVAEPLSQFNGWRYLVFFDDGYAQYVVHSRVLVVAAAARRVWEDVHQDSRRFIQSYLDTYPERPMVKVKEGQVVKTEWNGKWWIGRVLKVDCSLVHMYFEADNRSEWIYRGSTRLGPLYLEFQAATARLEKTPHIPKLQQKQKNINIPQPYVEYPKPVSPPSAAAPEAAQGAGPSGAQGAPSAVRAVARKSTNRPPNTLPQSTTMNMVPFLPSHQVTQPQSKVVYFTPKSVVPPMPYVPHTCSRACAKLITLPFNALKGYNPLSKPLLVGWHRQMFKYKGKKGIRYRAPCGRSLRNMAELHQYLRTTASEMSVDNFDFDYWVHCLAEFVLDKTYRSKRDISNGVENVPIPCVNYVDQSMPDFCSYSTKREPMEGVNLNLNENFLCGCDCTDDCADKTKCACWQLTIREARTLNKRVPDELIGYTYKRLPDCVTTGIYECNSQCKCAKTCLNRVVQHPLQLKLQLFKTANRGWGIRCLNDIPHGAFICIYAGSLLTDKMANEGGVNYGDEYLAELDYIEVVERQKDGYESDVTDIEDEDVASPKTMPDEDFVVDKYQRDTLYKTNVKAPTEIAVTTRSRNKQVEQTEDTVTISDDEETIREKSSFAPSSQTEDQVPASKFKSVRKMFGEDEVCYIMDAKNTGNIGRFLNHSCSPNVFVQNVFVDTHDLRFPWVAFFAMTYIRAGTELTWNYNYDVGSVPGKVIFCHCGSPDCRGRLL